MPRERHPITVMFGPKIDFSDLKTSELRATQKKAADRCLDAIKALADVHRAGG
jgi:hypothetical protein